MIRVREIVLRDASGAEIVARLEVDYDKESIKSDMSRRDGKPLPNGSTSYGTVNLPGGLTQDVGEFDLEDFARQDAQDMIDEGIKGGFAVASDETIDYPNGTEST